MQVLEDLFVDELHDLRSAEQKLAIALPEMAEAAQSHRLRQGFEGHVEQTYHCLDRLEQILKKLGPASLHSAPNGPEATVDVLMPLYGEWVPVESPQRSFRRRGALLDEELGAAKRAPTSQAMHDMIEEGRKLVEQNAQPHVKDIVLLVEAQCIEQYKVAGYAAAHSHARWLGHLHAEELLEQTLREGNETSGKLAELAESEINAAALQAG